MSGKMDRKNRTAGRWLRAGVVAGFGILAVLTCGMPAHAADEPTGRIDRIELKTEAAATKVIVMLSRPLAFNAHVLEGEAARKSARRLLLDFENTTLAPEAAKPIEVDDGLVRGIRSGTPAAGKARIVLDLSTGTKHAIDAYEDPPHVTVTITEAVQTESMR
ncbi:MAG: AMIN domain-containing protein [Candidatus Binatia bacterium]